MNIGVFETFNKLLKLDQYYVGTLLDIYFFTQ